MILACERGQPSVQKPLTLSPRTPLGWRKVSFLLVQPDVSIALYTFGGGQHVISWVPEGDRRFSGCHYLDRSPVV